MESGLCRPSGEFRALSRRFICVRLYYTAAGASEPFATFGLGDPARPDANINLGQRGEIKRNNADAAFLDPEGRPIDLFRLRPGAARAQGASDRGCWVRDLPGGERVGNGTHMVRLTLELMKEVAKLHPGKSESIEIPWQVSLAHAIFVSAWDSSARWTEREEGPLRQRRRVAIVSAPGGKVDPAVEKALGEARVLAAFEPYYVFVKLDPAEAPPELAEALRRAGPEGLAILDAAASVAGFGEEQWKRGESRTFPSVLETAAGPHTRNSVIRLLRKHAALPRPAGRSSRR